MSTLFNKTLSERSLMRAGTGIAIGLAIFTVATAADSTQADPPVASSGPHIVDWTPGSEWRKKVEREGKKTASGEKIAPPALGRDKMKVQAKRLERGGAAGSPPLTPPSKPSK